MITTVEHKNERTNGVIKHPTPNDCEEALIPGPERDRNICEESAESSSLYRRSDGSTSDEQDEPQDTLSILASSVPNSKARYDLLSLRSLIALLMKACNLELLLFASMQINLSSLLLLLLILLFLILHHHHHHQHHHHYHYHHPLIPLPRRYPIYR